MWKRNGNVGLGTDAPNQRLDVRGNASIDGIAFVSGRVAQRNYDSGDGAVTAGSGTGISGGAITLGAYAGGSFTWTHGLGFEPVLMGSIDQTGGGFADYVQWSYAHNGSTSTTFYFTNRSGNTATFRLRWIVVN